MDGFDQYHEGEWTALIGPTQVNGRSPAGVRVANLHCIQDALGDRARFRVPRRNRRRARVLRVPGLDFVPRPGRQMRAVDRAVGAPRSKTLIPNPNQQPLSQDLSSF